MLTTMYTNIFKKPVNKNTGFQVQIISKKFNLLIMKLMDQISIFRYFS
jgi:hypothetical protein